MTCALLGGVSLHANLKTSYKLCVGYLWHVRALLWIVKGV